jgi:hypothetical protein
MNEYTELEELALSKLSAVLGAERGRVLLDRMLEKGDFRLRSPEDLARLGRMLQDLGGFEAALGGMLGVQAAMRSAREGRS